jgi:hypothetical protein
MGWGGEGGGWSIDKTITLYTGFYYITGNKVRELESVPALRHARNYNKLSADRIIIILSETK